GIRDRNVTGVQTCALPISGAGDSSPSTLHLSTRSRPPPERFHLTSRIEGTSRASPTSGRSNQVTPQRTGIRLNVTTAAKNLDIEIGRASCRERRKKREERE